MYYNLTGALKRRIIRELKMCFREFFDKHKDILEFINHKYSFKQRPQKGIVVTGVGASPLRLSADNFVGTVISHAMLARVGQHKGHSIEWIREDHNSVRNNQGYFPSDPGIYYIEVLAKDTIKTQLGETDFQSLLNSEGDFPFYFYVDPLYTIKREPVLKVTSPTDTTGFVLNTPVLEDTIRLYEDDKPLITGHFLRLEAEESLKIESPSRFGLPTGQVPVSIEGIEQEPFAIQSGQNDLLDLTINGTDVSIPLNSGLRSSNEIAADIRNSLYGIISTQDYSLENIEGRLKITASESLTVSDNTLSTSNATLGLTSGKVPAIIEGNLFHPNIEEDFVFSLEINGSSVAIPFYGASYAPEDISNRINAHTTGLDAEVVEYGDYIFDAQTGRVDIIKPLKVGAEITADYKYKGESTGPYGIKQDRSNNHAIPGVVLAFGKRIQDHDKMAVVVHPDRVAVADEYGGRWDMSIDIDIITRDPMDREEISDMVLIYFFAIRKSSLTEEGIEITDVSFGGETEDIYDESAEEMYYNSSISLSMQTDWSLHVPKPLVIERVTPVSYEEEAKFAGTGEDPSSDLLQPQDAEGQTLKQLESIYLKGRNRDFEFIK